MEYIRILTCKAMTTDEIWVRILIYNDCGTEKFLNVFFPVGFVYAFTISTLYQNAFCSLFSLLFLVSLIMMLKDLLR